MFTLLETFGVQYVINYMLVCSKQKFCIMCKIRQENKSPLAYCCVKIEGSQNLQKAIGVFDGTWEQSKTEFYQVGIEVVRIRVRKHRDWFDENDKQINEHLGNKNLLHQKCHRASDEN